MIVNVPRPIFDDVELRTLHHERTDGERWGALFSRENYDHDLLSPRLAALAGQPIYRYALWRQWDENKPRLIIIGLNPSTADEATNDPTIRRCLSFARREGCGSLVMLNLFAFRSTEPKELAMADDPIGPHNDAVIADFVAYGGRVVAAWGTHGIFLNRDRDVARRLRGLECFGVNKDGTPQHPLYLPADRPLIHYPPRQL